MITKDRLTVGVVAVLAGLVAYALFDLLWRLLLVVLVLDIGLTLTYRWSNGMTCPMLCLLTTEAFYHYTRAVYVVVDATLSYWFPEHQELVLSPALRSVRG